MKIRIEIVSELSEDEVIIRCRQADDRLRRLEQLIQSEAAPRPSLVFYKQDEEFFFPISDVLFFETEGDKLYAHTAKDVFLIRRRLYELEQILPRQFIRVSKGTMLNVLHIYSIQKNLTSASLVQFANSHKQVYLSRLYYKECKQRLEEERSKS